MTSPNSSITYYGNTGSFHTKSLPEGCRRCLKGEKSVVYATGRCQVGCYYCTLPQDSKSKNVIRVNEIELNLDDTYLDKISKESTLSLASGAGITGGDPLSTPERTVEIITYLKNTFGSDFHIHLYTSGQYLTPKMLQQLALAGLDEIRFHPKDLVDEKAMQMASFAKKHYSDLIVGFEIPAIPGKTEAIEQLIRFANENYLDFVNLNEFEFTEANFTQLDRKGFVTELHSSAVKGSSSMVQEIIGKQSKDSLPLHFCSSASKDSIQLTNRFKRRASQVARPFESISEDGELEYGRLFVQSKEQLDLLVYLLTEFYEVPDNLMEVKTNTQSVETSWIIVEDLFDDLKQDISELRGEIISRHPVDDGPITYVEPIV